KASALEVARPRPRGDRRKRQGVHLGSIESRGSAIELIRLPTAAKPRVMDLLTRDLIISWLNPTPHATAVYASCSASRPPHATLASRRLATALPGPDLHRLIAPAFPAPSLTRSPRRQWRAASTEFQGRALWRSED